MWRIAPHAASIRHLANRQTRHSPTRKSREHASNDPLSGDDHLTAVREPHALRARRQRAGRAGAGDRAVFRPRLQYRLAHRLGDRAREASLAHHHRHPRHADGDRADQESARPPGAGAPGGRHHRRRPVAAARACHGQGARQGRAAHGGARASPTPSAPASSTPPTRASCSRSPARPTRSTASST